MIDLKKILDDKFFVKINQKNEINLLDFSKSKEHYSDSFFEEYKRYPKIQLDSFNKLKIKEERFYSSSKWTKNDLKDKMF